MAEIQKIFGVGAAEAREILAGALVVVATMGLAACAPGDEAAAPQASAVSASASVDATATAETSAEASASPTAVVTPSVGDSLNAEDLADKDLLATIVAAGLTVYETTTGQGVVLDPTQPLPEEVKDDIAIQIREVFVPDNGIASVSAARALAKNLTEETGRNIIVVTQALGSAVDEDEPSLGWLGAKDNSDTLKGTDTLDEILANVEAYIAAQDDPGSWDYIVKAD